MEWTTGLEYWNGQLEWHIFGFYTFLSGLIDSYQQKGPLESCNKNSEISKDHLQRF